MKLIWKLAASVAASTPFTALASVHPQPAQVTVSTGVSAAWILANISYAGMRAQNSPSVGWRFLAFLFGFPGTLVSFLAIEEGSGRAYGVDIPRRDSRNGP